MKGKVQKRSAGMKASNKRKIKMESQFSVNNRNANGAAKRGWNIAFQKGKAKENCSSKSILHGEIVHCVCFSEAKPPTLIFPSIML